MPDKIHPSTLPRKYKIGIGQIQIQILRHSLYEQAQKIMLGAVDYLKYVLYICKAIKETMAATINKIRYIRLLCNWHAALPR